jgi:hypothetical protein
LAGTVLLINPSGGCDRDQAAVGAGCDADDALPLDAGHWLPSVANLAENLAGSGQGCVFRAKSAGDSGMKSATDSDVISAIPI